MIAKKPAPDSVYEALRQLGVSKESAIYVGDSDVDIMTAKNADLRCICVTWGFRGREFLIEHGGTEFIDFPMELLEKILYNEKGD